MPEKPPDPAIALMLRAKSGDRAALGILYEKYRSLVYRFFYGLGADPERSSDLTQETFLRIWKYRARYAATGSFPAYILTFARYIWLEDSRNRRKRAPAALVDVLLADVPAPTQARPDEQASRTELSNHVREALLKLPEDQRMAFVLQAVQGLTIQETASVLQCPVNTVRSRKILAVKKLRAALRRTWRVGSEVT